MKSPAHPHWKYFRWLAVPVVVGWLLTLGTTNAIASPGTLGYYLVVVLITLGSTVGYLAAIRQNYRHIVTMLQRGQCTECDYELTGSVIGGQTQCPECGSRIPQRQANYLLSRHEADSLTQRGGGRDQRSIGR